MIDSNNISPRLAEARLHLKRVFGIDSIGIAKWIASLIDERDRLTTENLKLRDRLRNHEEND